MEGPAPEQDDLLNLGLNCHFMTKPRKHEKRMEIELLLDSIQQLEAKKILKTSDALQPLLLAEALTDRGNYTSGIFTKELKDAAADLKKNEEITICRADKTAAFVLIKTEEYFEKLDDILADTSKFERLTRNPTEDIKRDANRIITAVNAATNACHLPPIQGDYNLGYLYFLDGVPGENPGDSPGDGTMASLVVESLFTNVPVDETVGIILEKVYRSPDKQPPNIPEESLKTLLDICTKRASFTTHRGQMFRQKAGVAMGSPLGVLFANFYMGTVEERVFLQHRCPQTYARYIDDIFVQADSEEEVEALRQQFLRNSALNFTIEFSSEDRLPFLDVLITKTTPKMTTTVYTKSTNLGLCLNGKSECPARFKTTTVRAFVRRALTHCSAWQDTHSELD
ncbi:uncharacterized protein LOC135215761 [Macrobrachium nipponense]|uniref:uncharacterized protein LOC135215761 n=1 Tax=Macrobrachium nipponense TaxID=159736 RepID=UPI0030C8C612